MQLYTKPSISYMGMDQKTKRWKRIETYGGKLVENCVQAIARDCLAGDFICDKGPGEPVIVVEDWVPNEDAGRCRRGK